LVCCLGGSPGGGPRTGCKERFFRRARRKEWNKNLVQEGLWWVKTTEAVEEWGKQDKNPEKKVIPFLKGHVEKFGNIVGLKTRRNPDGKNARSNHGTK